MGWWPISFRPRRKPPATYGSFRREVRHKYRNKLRLPRSVRAVLHPRPPKLTLKEVLARQMRRAA